MIFNTLSLSSNKPKNIFITSGYCNLFVIAERKLKFHSSSIETEKRVLRLYSNEEIPSVGGLYTIVKFNDNFESGISPNKFISKGEVYISAKAISFRND